MKFLWLFLVATLCLLSFDSEARPKRKKKGRSHDVPSEILRGSLEARAMENRIADQWNLERFKRLEDLRTAWRHGLLKTVASSDVLYIDEELGEHDRENRILYALARPFGRAGRV
jgi:hypothetical protein